MREFNRFVPKVSHATATPTQTQESGNTPPVVPETPKDPSDIMPTVSEDTMSSVMEKVRKYFGQCWWVWLVVIVLLWQRNK